MSKEIISSDKIAPAAGPLSPAVRSGAVIYCSGQVALDPTTGRLIEGDVAAQTEQVIRNLEAVLQAAGKSLADIVRAGVFLTDMKDYVAMNAAYAQLMPKPYPARTAVAVAALPLGALVEIDAVVSA